MQKCLSPNSPNKGSQNKIPASKGGRGDTLKDTLHIFLIKFENYVKELKTSRRCRDFRKIQSLQGLKM